MLRLPLRSTLFPYTTLFRSLRRKLIVRHFYCAVFVQHRLETIDRLRPGKVLDVAKRFGDVPAHHHTIGQTVLHKDRKSTRLNSSHSSISYAVFCLKKKKSKL